MPTVSSTAGEIVDLAIHGSPKRALGYIISWHSHRTTYVSSGVELEQSPAVVMANTGDSSATMLKYYAKPPEVVMRRFVGNKPVIPGEHV
jgi:hypothetical protein